MCAVMNGCMDYRLFERKLIMDTDGYAGSIVILAVILYKGFCTVCESAVTEIDDRKVKNGKKSVLSDLLEKPLKLVTAFSVNRIFSAVLLAYMALFGFGEPLKTFFEKKVFGYAQGEPHLFEDTAPAWASFISTAIILILSVLTLTVFCEGIPKRLPAAKSERFAYFCAPFVKFLVAVLAPMTALSSLLTRLLSPLFGAKGTFGRDAVTEEEILMMVDAGSETGVVEESQRKMINNVFEFDDLTVSDIMTHRTDITAVDISAKVSDVVNAAISTGFSRIPVYEDTIDRIVGIICVKDLLCLVGSEAAENSDIRGFIREIIYLPESVPCGEAFKRLSEGKMQMAAVADEYGGTAGLVTMEDIVEKIVGNIQDEYDDEEAELTKISEDTYIIRGAADPEDILPVFGITLPDGNGFDTMSGFIVELLGRIPEENENPSAEYGGALFTVLVTEDKRITRIKAKILKDNENAIEEKESLKNEEEN